MGLHDMFPMKKGPALQTAKPYVKEVYQNLYPTTALPKGPEGIRSYKIGQIGHISYHSIPSQTGWVGLLVMALIFWKSPLHTLEMKIVAAVGAFLYTFAESAFTTLERGKNYTSLAQFLANLVYIPALVQLYPVALRACGLDDGLFPFVFAYPLNIWLLEILQHLFILTPIWGHNVAWCYSDYADERLGGVIRLGHAPAWWMLGALVFVGKEVLEALVMKLTYSQNFKLWE